MTAFKHGVEMMMTTRPLAEAVEYRPINDYALIGDCRGAALISTDASIDWLCFGRFDSPSIFAALLDSSRGGHFQVRPTGEYYSERRYLPGTNVLETTFHTQAGTVMIRDLMPVASEQERRAGMTPENELLREIQGLRGTVELEIHYDPRPGYGKLTPRLANRGTFGLCCETDHGLLVLRSDLALDGSAGLPGAHTISSIGAGDCAYLSLSLSAEGPAVLPALGDVARAKVERSVKWWREWSSRCTYRGPYQHTVIRSALALKLMAFAPSGAIVAAPTTSLPEALGGDKNWDYRFCWLRDASMTLRALFSLGFEEEGSAFLQWIIHATRLSRPELMVLYDVYGEAKVSETELSHLDGYRGSRPVRIGNDAHHQHQLDVYGEVVNAIVQHADHRIEIDRETVQMLEGIGKTVCRQWREPDHGIWEGRADPAHHTHSKVLCWVALDRLIELNEARNLNLPVELYRENRDAIRSEVEQRGFNTRIQSYTQVFDGDDVDASLLVLALHGYADPAGPRMRSTLRRIHEQLGRKALIYRYRQDNETHPEGAFGICGFWAVECQSRAGDTAGARQAFEELLTYANDLELFAEEVNPDTGEALGNFPQAFTHVGLINAALTLAGNDRPNGPAVSG